MRLIDADALLKQYDLGSATKYGNETAEQQEHSCSTLMLYEIAGMIEDAPTIEAVPVVHGEWIKGMYDEWFCSVCHEENCYAYDDNLKKFTDLFCPNCGADMRKKVE